MTTALAAAADDHQPHIRGIMLPSGDVLFSSDGSTQCPWCQLVDMQGCFMHLTCAGTASRPIRKTSSLVNTSTPNTSP